MFLQKHPHLFEKRGRGASQSLPKRGELQANNTPIRDKMAVALNTTYISIAITTPIPPGLLAYRRQIGLLRLCGRRRQHRLW